MLKAIEHMEQGGDMSAEREGRAPKHKSARQRKVEKAEQQWKPINYSKLPARKYASYFRRKKLSRSHQAAAVKLQQLRIFGRNGTVPSRPRKKYKPPQPVREVRHEPRGETRAQLRGSGPVMVALMLLTLCLCLPVVRGSPLTGYGQLAAYLVAPVPEPGSWVETRVPAFRWKRIRVGQQAPRESTGETQPTCEQPLEPRGRSEGTPPG
jgi:hypothetical protein